MGNWGRGKRTANLKEGSEYSERRGLTPMHAQGVNKLLVIDSAFVHQSLFPVHLGQMSKEGGPAAVVSCPSEDLDKRRAQRC